MKLPNINQMIIDLFNRFSARWSGSDTHTSNTALVVVVPRHCYQEKVENLPLSDPKELNKILNLRYADKLAVHMKVSKSQRATLVRTFIMDSRVKINFPNALFFIPSSLAVFNAAEKNCVTVIEEFGYKYFCAKSELDVFSTIYGGNIQSEHAFFVANNASGDLSRYAYRDSQAKSANFKTILPLVRACFVKPTDSVAYFGLKNKVFGLALLFILYNLVSLSYLSVPYNSSFSDVQREQILSLVEKEKNIRNYSDVIRNRDIWLEAKSNTVAVWVVLGEITGLGAEIISFDFDGSDLIVRGSASNATELIRKISAFDHLVSNAVFDAPVRGGAGTQSFVIRVTLK